MCQLLIFEHQISVFTDNKPGGMIYVFVDNTNKNVQLGPTLSLRLIVVKSG